jgi:hypothetical protein
MVDANAARSNSAGCSKKTTSKRRTSNQSQTRKPPSKATLRQMAKDWEHVT